MPRVSINKHIYMKKDLCCWIRGQIRAKGFTQAQVGRELGCSQQTLSYKLNQCSFTYEELIRLIKMLQADDQTILRLMKL